MTVNCKNSSNISDCHPVSILLSTRTPAESKGAIIQKLVLITLHVTIRTSAEKQENISQFTFLKGKRTPWVLRDYTAKGQSSTYEQVATHVILLQVAFESKLFNLPRKLRFKFHVQIIIRYSVKQAS